MKKSDTNTIIQELRDAHQTFIAERGWQKHQKPRSLAISIVLEAGELLEHFQWEDDLAKINKKEVAHELGDVLAYCIGLADALGIDLTDAFLKKLAQSAKKYPVELFNPNQDSLGQYRKIKAAYRANKPKPKT